MEGSIKRLDEEKRLAEEHREKIVRITNSIETIFLLEDLTMGDLLEIFGLFTSRANRVFENIKIKEIKEKYEI